MLNQNLLLTGDDGYNLTKSLRFRSSASAYLNRTPATTTNRQTWTYSFWCKRGVLSSQQALLDIRYGPTDDQTNSLLFKSNDSLYFGGYYTDFLETTQVFRDPSAWYHIMLVANTTQATASNRLKMYVNGSQITSFSTANYPAQNFTFALNLAGVTRIGSILGTSSFLDGYMAEVNFIDGQALTPSSFGETNALTGVWKPKKFSGTYGTNGFYLPFTNTTSTSTLGNDFSGNSNTWTVNNISLTAGTTYDSMVDVPTLTSATQANYCVLNPLSKNASATISNGNLEHSGNYFSPSTIFATSGKFYAEMTVSLALFESYGGGVGVVTGNTSFPIGIRPGVSGQSGLWYAYCGSTAANTTTYFNEGATSGSKPTLSANTVIQVAFDADNGKIWLGQNDTWYDSSGGTTGNPSTGANATYTFSNPSTLGGFTFVFGTYASGGSMYANFGQRPFSYTPPTGFVALNTFNLPEPSIKAGNKYMDATTYTGNGTNQTITNTAGFKPDLVWVKGRSLGYSHYLEDSVRGVGKDLSSNGTGAEATYNLLTSFNSNGFTVSTSGGTYLASNDSGQTFVGWQWQAGQGSTSSNTAGSITSTVSANPTAGFSVVTYTGNGTSGATVGHGLGVAPAMMIIKTRSAANHWVVYHQTLGNTKAIYLSLTGAADTNSSFWNNTSPTSSVLTLGTDTICNQNGTTYVAYCWSEVAGFSKFGSYTGNGSSDGSFLYLGFRPKYILIKSTGVQDWIVWDTARDTYNASQNFLNPNSSSAESGGIPIDFVSNGVKIRTANGTLNTNGQSYIYMAFAENPFKNALAR